MRERGQSTVELALCLPLLALILGAVVQVGVLATDRVRLWHAAREAARVAVVDPDPGAAEAAARRVGLETISVAITPGPDGRTRGRPLTATVTYRPSGGTPLLGALAGRIEMVADATMRIEQP